MTTAITSALYFGGDFEKACSHLKGAGYILNMLSKSRFNRRLYRNHELFLTLFLMLGETWKELNSESVYVIDSYPITACDNYRICRSRRYQGEEW